MFGSIANFFKKVKKIQEGKVNKESAKERLHLVLLQDRANVSADFLDMMKQEIIEVIKKYIDVDEKAIDVKLTNKQNSDGTTGAPALYANIPIVAIKNETRKISNKLNLEKMDNKKSQDKNNKEKKDKTNPNVKDEKSEVKTEEKKENKTTTTENITKLEKNNSNNDKKEESTQKSKEIEKKETNIKTENQNQNKNKKKKKNKKR